jgi:uncharacterized membrane protein YdjX (TVP38/TMEM64 family)
MAAVTPVHLPPDKIGDDHSPLLTVLRVAMLATLAGGSIYLLLTHAQWFENPLSVKHEVLSWGVWGPLAYIMLYAVGPSFLVPGAVMTIAGGLAFGALWGAVYSLIGADAGALVAFTAGRFLGKSFAERMVGNRFHNVLDRLTRSGFYVILYLRIVPVIPYNALNLLAGASPIEFRDYFWASAIGMIPGTVLFAFLGDSLWHPTSPRFFISVGLILCCFAAGEFYRRWKAVQF